jgi:PAS domain S-box-containing protein
MNIAPLSARQTGNGRADGEATVTSNVTEATQAKGDLLNNQKRLATDLAATERLHEISTKLIQEGNVEALYGHILDAAVDIMQSEYASMQMLYPERGIGGELRLLAYRGFNPEAAKFWEWVRADSESTCGAALRTGRRVIAPDVEKCDFMAGTEDLATYLQTGIHAVQTTPLVSRSGKLLGMISTHWRQPHQPSERDLGLLDVLARQAADLIERKQWEEALAEREAWLAGQKEALQAAMNGAPLDASLGVLARIVIEQLGQDTRAAFYLANHEGTSLHHVVGMPAAYAKEVDGLKAGPESLACGLATHTGQPVLTSDVTKEPLWQPWLWLAEQFDYRGCWSFPIHTSAGKFVGTLAVYSRQPREATPRDLALASVMTESAAIIISHHTEAQVRKRAEEALRESEGQMRLVADAMPGLIAYIDAEERYRFNNKTYEEWFGHSRDKVYGKSVEDVLGEGAYAAIRPYVQEALRGQEVTFESQVPYRDGGTRWVEATYIPSIRDGRVEGFFALVLDVSERKQAEDSQVRLAAIVESSDDAIVSKDLNGIVKSWNRGAEKIFGYTAEEVIGRSITLIIPPDRIDEERMILERIGRGERIEHYETVRVCKNGQHLPISLTISPIKDRVDRIIGASKIARDMTERKRAEEQIKASLREKNILLKELNHRVKNNLQIVSSLLSMQADDIVDAQARAKFRESQERIQSISLIHEKLYQSRNLNGIDMADYIQSLVNSLLHSYKVRPEPVAVTVDADRTPIRLDTAVICGLMLNELVTNALKYAFVGREKGTLRIGFREEEPGQFSLTVSDDGVGLPDGMDFHNAESLGLQLVNELTYQLHGTIELEQDQGTTVRIRFAQVGRGE